MTHPESIALSENTRLEMLKSRGTPRLLLMAMRPHQWIKNSFILTPLLFGEKLNDLAAVVAVVLAFVTFCLMASAVYLVNDCVDAAEDRAHPEKRLRPISSGAVSISLALSAAAAFLFVAFGIAASLGQQFVVTAAIYCALMFGYSLSLKRVMILDCMIIASGFVLRVVSGAIAAGVRPSHWLMVCAFLLALYLAFTKRRQEMLMLARDAAAHRRVLSAYTVNYLDQVNNILIGAAIVCYALYTVAPETTANFGTDALIYGTVFVVYGLLRYMALTLNPANGGNPSKMLLRDKPLLLTVAGWSIYNALVIYQDAIRYIVK